MIIGSSREHHENVSSTNTLATLRLREGKPAEGLVITASFQEGGRGQQGNTWESEACKNLLLSIILYPSVVKAEEQFILSRMASLAVFDLIRHETPEVRIKWPNDIYVGDDKIAGILIENSLMGENISSSIIGIGLNINQLKFSGSLPNPVSLAGITGREHDAEKLLNDLLRLMDRRYRMILDGDRQRLSGDYHGALYRCNEWHRYTDSAGEFTGMIEGVRDNGMLVVRHITGGTREYSFKEIGYLF